MSTAARQADWLRLRLLAGYMLLARCCLLVELLMLGMHGQLLTHGCWLLALACPVVVAVPDADPHGMRSIWSPL